MSKTTATMLQVVSSDGENRQQMIVFADKSVFRRTLTGTTRTRWRHAAVGDLPTWVAGYVNLLKVSPTPMDLNVGPLLMEVTADEVTNASAGSLDRNVGLRFTRVLDAIEADPTTAAVTPDTQTFVSEWLDATSKDDNGWLDAHTHSAGTARGTTPEPEPEVTEPEAEPVVAVSSHGWTYPAIKGGYVIRPNSERYKVRKIDGTADVKVLQDSREYGEHCFLYGEPGTGKTALVDSAFGTDFVTMLGTEETEVSDFLGGYTTRGGGTYGWSDGAMVEAMERGVPLFVDEIGVIAPKVMTTLYSVMDGRSEIRITANPDRGTVIAQPGFFVIGATNPHAPGVRLSEALLSRFGVHVEVTTDYAVAREMGVADVLVTAAENLDKRRATGEIGWAPQMRELLRAKRQWDTRGDKFAIRNLIGSAPEDDRPVVQEVLARTTGKKVTPLSL